MKYYKGNLLKHEVTTIAEDIKKGKIFVFPTETVYGLGTNAYREESCKQIYEIKKRPAWKPLIVLISDIEMLNDLVKEINEIEKKLIDTFWPGSLTIVFQKKENSLISKYVSAGLDTLGIRMTDGEIIRAIIKEANVPIVAPSANLSGLSDGTKINEIIEEIGNDIDGIVDIGDISDSIPSTLVQVIGNKINVLREGKISKAKLSEIAEIL
ncbi:MAG: threonylcarbamoyl-AMP synthase [Bacilli bacterium]|nr:threonylcarbamoyl-AMP synthase [Bacilli bacterium]